MGFTVTFVDGIDMPFSNASYTITQGGALVVEQTISSELHLFTYSPAYWQSIIETKPTPNAQLKFT